MKLSDFAVSLEKKLKEMFPASYVHVEHSTNICDSVHVYFTKQPKEEWNHGIYQNGHYVSLMVTMKDHKQREGEGDLYCLLEPTMSYKLRDLGIKDIRRKSGTLPILENHIVKWFMGLE